MINCTVTCTLPDTPSLSRLFPPSLLSLQCNCDKSHKCVNFFSLTSGFFPSVFLGQKDGVPVLLNHSKNFHGSNHKFYVTKKRNVSTLPCSWFFLFHVTEGSKKQSLKPWHFQVEKNFNFFFFLVLVFSFPKSYINQILVRQTTFLQVIWWKSSVALGRMTFHFHSHLCHAW